MRVIRCRRCKQMYEYEGLPPECCPACKKAEEERYLLVRSLVKQHPGITAHEIALQTGISIHQILGYVKDGKLEQV